MDFDAGRFDAGRIIRRGIQGMAPDWVNMVADGAGSKPGLVRVRRPHWPAGKAIEIPASGVPSNAGAAVPVKFHDRNRQLPYSSTRKPSAVGAMQFGGVPVPTVYPAIWLGPEGWPNLPGGPQAVEPQPQFSTSSSIESWPGYSPGSRIQWRGLVSDLRDGGRQFVLLTQYEEEEREDEFTGDGVEQFFELARVPTAITSVKIDGIEQTEGLEWDLDGREIYFYSAPDDGAAIAAAYTCDVAAGQVVSRVGGVETVLELSQSYAAEDGDLAHVHGFLYLDDNDGYLTVVAPDGLRSLNTAMEATFTAWPTESLRLSKDLGVSVGAGFALQHNWPGHESTDPGRVIRGWTRAANQGEWEAGWTKGIFDLAIEGAVKVLRSGPIGRFDPSEDAGEIALLNRRQALVGNAWIVGCASYSGSYDEALQLLTGSAALNVCKLVATTGALTKLAIVPDLEPIELVSGVAALEAAQAYWDTIRDDLIEALIEAGSNYTGGIVNPLGSTSAAWVYGTYEDWVYNETTEEWELVELNAVGYYTYHNLGSVQGLDPVPTDVSPGVPLPAPYHDPGAAHPDWRQSIDANLQVRHNQNKLYTVVFVPRAAIRAWDGGPNVQEENVVAERLPPENIVPWWREYGGNLAPTLGVVWETHLICINPTSMTREWTRDITYRYTGVDGDHPAALLPVWRNVWDWTIKGRVAFVLRDWHYDVELGAEIEPGADWEPCLEIFDLAASDWSTPLHRVRFEHTPFSFGATLPDLLSAGVDSEGREWCDVTVPQPSGQHKVVRVKMAESLGTTPTINRHDANESAFPVGVARENLARTNAHSYWLTSNGTELRRI